MKIISRGTDPKNDVFKGTCSYCKTVFECQRHEGRYEEDFREGGGFLRVDCPVCSKSAIAYKRNDGAQIPRYSRDQYTWRDVATSIGGDGGWGSSFPGLMDR